MKLRYLHIENLPPLNDIEIRFVQETLLGRKCAIRFVVGVNGSGKSRLLQAIAQIFVHLERQQMPPFPVTLAYDLDYGGSPRTIFLYHDPSSDEAGNEGPAIQKPLFIPFAQSIPEEVNWEDLPSYDWTSTNVPFPVSDSRPFIGGELPGLSSIGAYLPNPVLAYTSGATTLWDEVFTPPDPRLEDNFSDIQDNLNPGAERPLGWSVAQEAQFMQQEQPSADELQVSDGELDADPQESSLVPTLEAAVASSVSFFVTPEDLKLAFLSVVLLHSVTEFPSRATEQEEKALLERIDASIETGKHMPGLRGLLNEVDWLWPITVALHFKADPADLGQPQTDALARLAQAATTALRDPRPGSGRHLFFDLWRTEADLADANNSTAQALLRALAGDRPGAFDVFRVLRTWRQQGFLTDVDIALRKRHLNDLLLFKWLSDGEQVFLGRIALFQLVRDDIQARNALILLDEPETHFNDIWKRRIVDIIDDNLWDTPSEVLISTHSSIALTDVFDTEITLLRKDPTDGSVAVVRTPARTFGASPTDIMEDIFGAPYSVGQRASEFLDLVLIAAAHPQELEAVWQLGGADEFIMESDAFKHILAAVAELPHDYGDIADTAKRLVHSLRAVRIYTQVHTGKSAVSVADVLTALQERLGPGYYQLEFRRRIRGLKATEESVNGTSSH
jgi:predicted ATPase